MALDPIEPRLRRDGTPWRATARPVVAKCPNDPGGTGLWLGYHCKQDATLRQRYGPDVTCEVYWTYFELQQGRCAVCHRKPSKRYRLVVDHDHDTGLVRGLIHGRCNRWITTAVVRYIMRHPGQQLQVYVSKDKMQALAAAARERVRKEHAKQDQRKRGYVAPKRVPERPSSVRSKLR